jgi:hypothetical protein
VNAALQVEAELQLLRHEPRRRGQSVGGRKERIHPDAEEHGEDREDEENFPAKILVHR